MRCAQRHPHRAAQRPRVHRIGAERAHRSAQQHRIRPARSPPLVDRLVGAQPEQIVGQRADQIRRGAAVVAASQPAQHRYRHSSQLALDQVGGRGDLVGDGDLGGHQLVAVPVDSAQIAVQHAQPGRPDRRVGLPDSPRPTHRVGDHHGHIDAQRLGQPGTQPRGAGVRVDGQQRDLMGLHIGRVHPRRGLHHAQRVHRDQGAAAAGEHSPGLGGHQLASGRVPGRRVGRHRDQPSLHLGHHLAGDDDVAVDQPRRSADQCADQIVPRPELGQPPDRQDADLTRRCVIVHSGGAGNVHDAGPEMFTVRGRRGPGPRRPSPRSPPGPSSVAGLPGSPPRVPSPRPR